MLNILHQQEYRVASKLISVKWCFVHKVLPQLHFIGQRWSLNNDIPQKLAGMHQKTTAFSCIQLQPIANWHVTLMGLMSSNFSCSILCNPQMAFVEPECFWETCHISDLCPGKQPPYNGLWTCPKIKAFSVLNLPDINRLPAFQLSSATRGRAADTENSFSASLCLSFLSL